MICNVSVDVNKEFKRDDTQHTSFSKFSRARKNKLSRLINTLKQQSSVFQSQTTESENNTLASYKVAQLTANDKGLFTHGDFVKKCMMALVETVYPEKKLFTDVSFFARTITRRRREMSENVKYNQKDCFEDLQFFSIAIDESADTTDTAQLAVFVRGVNEDFHVVEDFVQLIPMMDTTSGADILKAFSVLKP